MVTITLDERRRAPLAKLARDEDDQYLAEVLPDGRILLTPAVTISKNQAILNNHPEILAAIDQLHDGKIIRGPRPSRER
jgi:hypothetical protein